ncbi:ABC transporter substrate-binding protein [Bombiscardovia nodaiensis]|uniref:ABC transporter substrate-binding protein n=1 Tax=Bombiscardovia nodaiensis TaxID=2932181 RepID=A0ABN6SDJ1_9BIFI|nr:ABC transporter substrate-binding protein [Bombiscardovia nodaiensis]
MVSLMTLALGGCSNAAASYDVSAIGPKIHVGIVTDEPGIGFVRSGQYSGLDVDVARYIIHELGYVPSEIVWHGVRPSNREQMLEKGQVDMVVGSYSITQERRQAVDFAGPYFIAGQDLLVRKGDTQYQSVEDLGQARVCTVEGSTAAQNLQTYAPQAQVEPRQGIAVCITALLTGEVDAVSDDDMVLAGQAHVSGGGLVRLVGNPFTQEHYGVAVRKGQPTLVAQINAALNSMMTDGSWQRSVSQAADSIAYRLRPGDHKPSKLDGSPSKPAR